MVACAMVCAYFVLRADITRRGLASDKQAASADAELFIAVPSLAGIVGAKLYHVFQSPHDLFSDPLGQIFSQYGFAWFGGLIAGFAAFGFLAKLKRIPFLEMLDAGSPAAAIGYGIGRIGCLLSGDGDYGTRTSLPWGLSFPHGLVPTDERVHPTPIYELIVACVIARLLWRLGAWTMKHPRRGDVFAAYLFLTGAARFLVEFIRINPRSFFGMTNAQTASLLSMLAGAFLWWWVTKGLPKHSASNR